MHKALRFLDDLNEVELDVFERSIKHGTIQQYIERKKEFYKIKDKQCPVCGNNVDDTCVVLVWGDASLRKKGHFCGVDCVEFFMNKHLKTKLKKTSTLQSKREEQTDGS